MLRQQARTLAVLAALAVAAPGAAQVITRGAAQRIAGLLADVDHPLAGGYRYSDVRIDRDRVTMVLSAADGNVVGRIHLEPPAEAKPGDRRSRTFAIHLEVLDPAPQVRAALDAGVASIVHHDAGGLLSTVPGGAGASGGGGPGRLPQMGTHLTPGWRRALWLAQVILALLLFAGTAVFVLRRGGGAGRRPSP